MLSRFKAVCSAAAQLMCFGFVVFSPIAHSHAISVYGELSGDYSWWRKFDLPFLRASKCVVVYMLEGYGASVGVCDEIAEARAAGIPVLFWQAADGGFESCSIIVAEINTACMLCPTI
jgi:hypothetical protein